MFLEWLKDRHGKCIDVKGDRVIFEEVKLLYDLLGFKIKEA